MIGSLRDQIRYPSGLAGVASVANDNSSAPPTAAVLAANEATLPAGDGVRDSTGGSSGDSDQEDGRLLELLRLVGLEQLASRMGGAGGAVAGLGARRDWGAVLSLGEQQRLAFARVLYNRPTLVFLDGALSRPMLHAYVTSLLPSSYVEATSALDVALEERMYGLLDGNVTYVSVGHRPSLQRFHTSKVIIEGSGTPLFRAPIESYGDEQFNELSLIR